LPSKSQISKEVSERKEEFSVFEASLGGRAAYLWGRNSFSIKKSLEKGKKKESETIWGIKGSDES